MPLAALIAAQDETDIGDGLRATLALAGRTLIEYQAGLAMTAGAGHVVVLVERVPAALAQAVDRLRRQGMRVEIARSVSDAADRFHPQERILLIADGAIAAQQAVDALALQDGSALLALPDTEDYADFERIDAAQRWGGFALFGKGSLDATIQMLGDWDLTSTVLRRLVQTDAVRIDALNPSGDKLLAPPVLATGPGSIGVVEAGLLRRAERGDGNWAEAYLHRLLASPLVGPLVARHVDHRHVALGAVIAAWFGALFAVFHFFWVPALLLPLAALAASTARRMARIWGEPTGRGLLFTLARHAAGLVVLILLARTIAIDGGWGWWLVAAFVPLALGGLIALEPIVDAIQPQPSPRWLASADALLWCVPPFAILGGWRWMVAALAFYAVLSFGERFVAAWKGARIYDR